MTDIATYLYDENVLNIYKFGSHVYGSNNAESDEDFIVVLRHYVESDDINIHHYTEANFQDALKRHDIQALECYFSDPKFALKETIKFNFALEKSILRVAISTIASNSWVKGKKKLIVSGDYDLKLAIKSIFHSLRILDYGIQIASENKISNYSSMNWLLEDLWKLSHQFQREELWSAIDTKYRKIFNAKSSEFKSLAPKSQEHIQQQNKRQEVIEVFKSHGIVFSDEIISKIMIIFEK